MNGHAVGAGLAIAAASDLRLASTAATFADGFVKRGISGCEMGLSYFLPKLIGPALAFDLMLSGRRMLADEALRAGLVRHRHRARRTARPGLRAGGATRRERRWRSRRPRR
ncbi:MAG: enoyl-CoA hydratase/isomerase family protein [Acidimicrobiales bacterium]